MLCDCDTEEDSTAKKNRKLNVSIRFKVQLSTTVTEINAYSLLNVNLPSELDMD